MKDLVIKKVENEEEIENFREMEYMLSTYFIPFARKQGICDIEIENYSMKNTLKYLDNKRYHNYIAKLGENYVGFVTVKKKRSKYDGKTIIEIVDLYVDSKYRKKGIGEKLFRFVKEKYKMRIELSCFYDAPANDFYKHLGGKVLECLYTF